MANFRLTSVKMWDDEWFHALDNHAKVVFVYLFTNQRTSASGIYELPLHVMAAEIPMKPAKVLDILRAFEADGKAFYSENVVWVRNMREHQSKGSATLDKRIQADIDSVPECRVKSLYLAHYSGDSDSLSIAYAQPIDTVARACGRADSDPVVYEDEDGTGTTPPDPATAPLIAAFRNTGITTKLSLGWLKRALSKEPKYATPETVERCIAYYRSHGKQVKDWAATFYTWCANQEEFDRRKGATPEEERQVEYERRAEARVFHAEDLGAAPTDEQRAQVLKLIADTRAAFAARKMPEEAQR